MKITINAKELREKIADEVLNQYHKKIRNVFPIAESNVFVVEGNNHQTICYATISNNGDILLSE